LLQLLQELPILDPKQNPGASKMPPKKFFGNMDPAFVQERRHQLEIFFEGLLEFEDVRDHQSVRAFLQIS